MYFQLAFINLIVEQDTLREVNDRVQMTAASGI